MASNPTVNKVVYGGTTLIDLTSDTITASDVKSGVIFHAADGSTQTGTMAVATVEETLAYLGTPVEDLSEEAF